MLRTIALLAVAPAVHLAAAAAPAVTDPPELAPPSLRVSALRPLLGQAFVLRLNLPRSSNGLEAYWHNSRITGFTLLEAGEKTDLMPLIPGKESNLINIRFGRVGPALVTLTIQPPKDWPEAGTWPRTTTYTKLVLAVGSGKSRTPLGTNPKITAPVRQFFELVPMKDPTALEVGDELPVQVLRNGKPMADAEVIAGVIIRGSTNVQRRLTDSEGKAIVKLNQAARWLVRCSYTPDPAPLPGEGNTAEPGEMPTFTAELMFELATERLQPAAPSS